MRGLRSIRYIFDLWIRRQIRCQLGDYCHHFHDHRAIHSHFIQGQIRTKAYNLWHHRVLRHHFRGYLNFSWGCICSQRKKPLWKKLRNWWKILNVSHNPSIMRWIRFHNQRSEYELHNKRPEIQPWLNEFRWQYFARNFDGAIFRPKIDKRASVLQPTLDNQVKFGFYFDKLCAIIIQLRIQIRKRRKCASHRKYELCCLNCFGHCHKSP